MNNKKMKKFCNQCGSSLEQESKFCSSCGFEIKHLVHKNIDTKKNKEVNFENRNVDKAKKLKKLLFTYDGCITRSDWWYGHLFWFLPIIAISILVGISIVVINPAKNGSDTSNDLSLFWILAGIFSIAIYIPLIYSSFCLNIKRWHDLGYSGWFNLFFIIPIINWIALMFLCFVKGGKGEKEEIREEVKEKHINKSENIEVEYFKNEILNSDGDNYYCNNCILHYKSEDGICPRCDKISKNVWKNSDEDDSDNDLSNIFVTYFGRFFSKNSIVSDIAFGIAILAVIGLLASI